MSIRGAARGFSGEPGIDAVAEHTSVAAVWSYLADCLAEVASLRSAGGTRLAELAETRLTSMLIDKLHGRQGDRPFYFHKEPGEPEGRFSVDVDVRPRHGEAFRIEGRLYQAEERFLALEAKRLPAPEKSREREYLQGDLGGVERFKADKHGQGLKMTGLLGYVQRCSAGFWLEQVNGWVEALVNGDSHSDVSWDEQDKLVADNHQWPPGVTSYRSAPLRRSDGCRLSMRHLWVELFDRPEQGQG